MFYHIPVLQDEAIEGLNIDKDGIYVDATLGGGGHSLKILEILKNGKGYLIGIDQDEDAINFVKVKLKEYVDIKKLIIVKNNFELRQKYKKDVYTKKYGFSRQKEKNTY